MIDAAHQSHSEGLLLVFLDWAKAFDRIRVDSMIKALTRFGLPGAIVDMIHDIYSARHFFIQDHAGPSTVRSQCSGIAQGCQLSPFLFILVQTVILRDVLHRVVRVRMGNVTFDGVHMCKNYAQEFMKLAVNLAFALQADN